MWHRAFKFVATILYRHNLAGYRLRSVIRLWRNYGQFCRPACHYTRRDITRLSVGVDRVMREIYKLEQLVSDDSQGALMT